MTKYLSLILLFFALNALGDKPIYDKNTIKIAVIDTGFDFDSDWKKYGYMAVDNDRKPLVKPKLCNYGHRDFTNTNIKDSHGHGTHIAGIIAKYAENSNYCLVILKTYDSASINAISGAERISRAFFYAIRLGVDIVNYSGGGESFDIREYLAVKKALDKGIVVVTAAGNEGKIVNHHVLKVDIKFKYIGENKTIIHKFKPYYINRKTSKISTITPNNSYYPAAYDPRIISVVNIHKNGKIVNSSNKGHAFMYKELGVDILSIMPNNSIGRMTGTSQSTAIKTGKIVNSWNSR